MGKLFVVNDTIFEFGSDINWNKHLPMLKKGRKIIEKRIRQFVNYDNIIRMAFDNHFYVISYKDSNDRFSLEFKTVQYPKAFAYLLNDVNKYGLELDECFYLIEMILLADESNYSKCPDDMKDIIISDISLIWPEANEQENYDQYIIDNFRPMSEYDKGRFDMITAMDDIFNSTASNQVEDMFDGRGDDETIAQDSFGYHDLLDITWSKARKYMLKNFDNE